MSYFLAPHALSSGLRFVLEGEEADHLLKSRRLRAGDRFALQGPDGERFSAEVVEVARRSTTVQVLEPLPVPPLPHVGLTLLLAAVKDKALELVLQKITELGAAGVVIFPSEYSPVAHVDLASPKTLARWERIVREACKQSDRQFPPRLQVAASLDAALAQGEAAEVRLVLNPRAEAPVAAELGGAATVALLIGPEGGFTAEEVEQAARAGYRPVRLGGLILRADTAAIAMAAVALLGGPSPR